MLPKNQSELQQNLLKWALFYGELGLPVHPLGDAGSDRAKTPRLKSWQTRATTDPEQIKAFWAKFPNANIGIATGHGVDVLDLDGKDAQELLSSCPQTPTVLTGRNGGGRHLYLKSSGMKNGANVHPQIKGVDFRGEGGYVVAPPSIHPSGRVYSWEIEPGAAEFAPAPAWLAECLSPRAELLPEPPAVIQTTAPDAQRAAYADRALSGILDELSTAAQGERNNALNKAAHRAGRLIGGGVLDATTACRALLAGAQALGLSEYEARKTIGSGVNAGQRDPFVPEYKTAPAPLSTPAASASKKTAAQKKAEAEAERVEAARTRAAQGGVDNSWVGSADVTKEGRIKFGAATVRMAIQAGWLGFMPGWDKSTDRVVNLSTGEPLSLDDSGEFMLRLFELGFADVRNPYGDIRAALIAVAKTHEFNSLTDWAASKYGQPWDRQLRAHRLFSYYFHATEDEPGYVAALGLYVAMRLYMGANAIPFGELCIAPCLVGETGCGKSYFGEIVGGEKLAKMSFSKARELADLYRYEEGKFICEIEEMAGYDKQDADAIKAYLSDNTLTRNVKYKEELKSSPRTALIYGTTNRDEVLRADEAGSNRRIAPITVCPQHKRAGREQMALFDELRADLPQIIAEGGAIYQELGPGAVRRVIEAYLLGGINARYSPQDSYARPVEKAVRGRDSIHIEDLLDELDIALKERSLGLKMRLAKILRALSYQSRVERKGAATLRIYRKTDEEAVKVNTDAIAAFIPHQKALPVDAAPADEIAARLAAAEAEVARLKAELMAAQNVKPDTSEPDGVRAEYEELRARAVKESAELLRAGIKLQNKMLTDGEIVVMPGGSLVYAETAARLKSLMIELDGL